MPEQVECVVIGAGVIGLAVARQLSQSGREVLILEREDQFGTQLSSRNSGVIHSGIYYPSHSLKASLCLQGNALLYRFCEQRKVNYSRYGKLIVATHESQLESLRQLQSLASINGVKGVAWLGRDAVSDLEPEVQCIAALHCASTGVVDVYELMLALLGDAERAGAVLSLGSEVNKISVENSQLEVDVVSNGAITLRAKEVVNCSGLSAQRVALTCAALSSDMVPEVFYAKGNYYSYAGKSPFQRLVYPMPNQEGLGIHATVDLGGQLRFGPDVEWVDEVDFKVNEACSERFINSIREYWPGVNPSALTPDFASIRPKTVGPGANSGDFWVQVPADHGVAGLYNLYGIESPGLTSCMAIAEYTVQKMDKAR
ncbi:MAG: FAD-dependent oxidoreductase [Moraxellaceae bacterium]|nr:MAG: FAD-dependent oxidoreductase [Moraxellaceae bacterium]